MGEKPIFDIRSENSQYFRFTFTKYGNEFLGQQCFTDVQKEVWTWPSSSFLVKKKKDGKPSIRKQQIDTKRPSYINGLLIASRGKQGPMICRHGHGNPFLGDVRLPGTWNSTCACCKWKESGYRKCSYFKPGEKRWIPARGALKEKPKERQTKPDAPKPKEGTQGAPILLD